jgi:hypothetical protein
VTADSWLPLALLAQGVLGGIDTLVNHELVERLPTRPEARREIGLHSVREAVWAILLAGLGWFAWHGAAALVIAALLALELLITARSRSDGPRRCRVAAARARRRFG